MSRDATHWRKKPVVIEAVQWDESMTTLRALEAKGMRCVGHEGRVDQPDLCRCLRIRTLEDSEKSAHYVSFGDWIIKGVKGEFYACKPDIFAMTYEPASAVSEIAPMPDHFEGPGTMASALKPNEQYLRAALPPKYHDFYDKILLPLAQRGAESMRPSAPSATRRSDLETIAYENGWHGVSDPAAYLRFLLQGRPK